MRTIRKKELIIGLVLFAMGIIMAILCQKESPYRLLMGLFVLPEFLGVYLILVGLKV